MFLLSYPVAAAVVVAVVVAVVITLTHRQKIIDRGAVVTGQAPKSLCAVEEYLWGKKMCIRQHPSAVRLPHNNTHDDTPPQANFEVDYLDHGGRCKQTPSDACVGISTSTYRTKLAEIFPEPPFRLCASRPSLFWRNSARKFVPGGVLSYHTCYLGGV